MDGLLNAVNDLDASMRVYAPGQEYLALAAFGVYTLLILGGGLLAVMSKSLVRALVGLIVTFLGVAGMYLLLASPFMAFMQLLIYVGAVCVLIFFAIMLVRAGSNSGEDRAPGLRQVLYAALAALAPLALFGSMIYRETARLALEGPPVETDIKLLGQNLLENYVVPFELISIVLLVAMAGGALLAFEKRGANR